MILYGADSILPLLREAETLASSLEAEVLVDALEPLLWIVERASERGIKLAPSGRLGRAIVQAADGRFGFSSLASFGHKAQNEDDVPPPLVALRQLTRSLGLARTHKGRIVATAKGRLLLEHRRDESSLRDLFPRACGHVCAGDSFIDELTSLTIVLLVDAGPDGRAGMELHDELGLILAQRWKLGRVGNPPHDHWDIAIAASDARAKLVALRLLEPRGDFRYSLNGAVGLAGAALALRARLEAASADDADGGGSPLVDWAIEQGFDVSDQASLDEATRAFNALSFDERGRILGLD